MRSDEGPERPKRRAAVYRHSHPLQLANAQALLARIVRYCPTSNSSNKKDPPTREEELAHFRVQLMGPRSSKSQPSTPQESKGELLGELEDQFSEVFKSIREDIQPLKHARVKFDGSPSAACWTKMHQALETPEFQEASRERFEAPENYVVVLRVLSSAEFKGYTAWTKKVDRLQKNAKGHPDGQRPLTLHRSQDRVAW